MSEDIKWENYFDFMGLLKNMDFYYTQMINGTRIRKHNVVYIFDEVGCGKTVSAIIAIASLIKNKNYKNYKILVVTCKSVCNQFENEIKEKLEVDSNIIYNIAFENGNELNSIVKKIMSVEKAIVITNPQKVGIFNCLSLTNGKIINNKNIPNKEYKPEWDLIIVDEAHDIICNNKKQTDVFLDNKIDIMFEKYLKKDLRDLSKGAKIIDNRRNEFKKCINNLNLDYPFLKQYLKYLAIEEYEEILSILNGFNWEYIQNVIQIGDLRIKSTKVFTSLCSLRSEKIMFLSATPYKNNRYIDFLNYVLVASKVVKNSLFDTNFLPNLDWVKDFYTGKISLEKMQDSNTSFMFKEITNSICLNKKNISNFEYKQRKVELWYEDEYGESVLKTKIFEILEEKDIKNRMIIFVSNSLEGKYIFKKIFPNSDYDIVKDDNHTYVNNGIVCKFVMKKFGNVDVLKTYSTESNKKIIPDILIVTWQVAQAGINLPIYNYVINYHIPFNHGYMEQRYGRIDRLGTDKNPLYNIFYFDNSLRTFTYKLNFSKALYDYVLYIFDSNLPVKNLLLRKDYCMEKISEQVYAKMLATCLYYNEIQKNDSVENIIKNKCDYHITKEKIEISMDGKKYDFIKEENFSNDENCEDVELINKDSVDSKIILLIEEIEDISNYNKKVKFLNEIMNKQKMEEPGSIIINDNNVLNVIKVEDIIKQISNLIEKKYNDTDKEVNFYSNDCLLSRDSKGEDYDINKA